VVENKEDRLLLVSEMLLDSRRYNESRSGVTWETCSLRKWLNGEFLNAAFSEEEQTAIPVVTVTRSASMKFDTDPGNDTEDKVFLLGLGQLQSYFKNGGYCRPTAYAVARGCRVDNEGYCRWWLRTPGDSRRSVIMGNGGVVLFCYDVNSDGYGVRPALWFDLKALDEPYVTVRKHVPVSPEKLMRELNAAEAGNLVTFGSYEQDNDTSDGKEAIVWRVLAREDDRLLVVSEKALDWRQYNEECVDVTWETCSLRAWLNGEFLNAAFSDEERAKIPTVTVSADPNPGIFADTDPGRDVQDRVFLLSFSELVEYLASYEDRQCLSTDYARAQDPEGNRYFRAQDPDNSLCCWWWLRSPGDNRVDFAGVVRSSGQSSTDGHRVDNENGVRPAMWIDLSA
jgi:hypothetical protein